MSDAGITCEGRLESLAPLLAYVGRVSDDAGLRSEDAFAVRLAVEEVCTNVITHGYGIMHSYADRVAPQDRWAIVAYIRALQLSQHATINDASPEDRAKLQSGGQKQ